MNTLLPERCRELARELEAERAAAGIEGGRPIRELENELTDMLDQLLPDDAGADAALVDRFRQRLHLLALRARVHKARAEAFATELGAQAGAIETRLDEQVSKLNDSIGELSDTDAAAIEIEREMHEAKGTFKEILASLLMWREAPEERLEKQQQTG